MAGLTVDPHEWGGACDPCRVTWIWVKKPTYPRRADLEAARCPGCAGVLRPAHGQAAYETHRVLRAELGLRP